MNKPIDPNKVNICKYLYETNSLRSEITRFYQNNIERCYFAGDVQKMTLRNEFLVKMVDGSSKYLADTPFFVTDKTFILKGTSKKDNLKLSRLWENYVNNLRKTLHFELKDGLTLEEDECLDVSPEDLYTPEEETIEP